MGLKSRIAARIREIRELIRNRKKEIAIGLILILIISLSFGIGYLWALEFNRAPIIIQKFSR